VPAYIDSLSASIVQNGGVLTFVAETRGAIPTSVSGSGEYVRFIWFVDGDQNSSTGQPHGSVGSEFNVRAVIDPSGINGYVDVTGALPGGGLGNVTIVGNRIEMTVGPPQIASPGTFKSLGFFPEAIITVFDSYSALFVITLSISPARLTSVTSSASFKSTENCFMCSSNF
jgi:hypothetical protein